MVAELGDRLEKHGILDSTYLIFTTDNGYHVGQHRLQPGKQCSYKEDINIPFIVRGPGVPKKHTSRVVTSHTDLAATFLELAGAPPRSDLDGDAMPLTERAMDEAKSNRQEHVNVEMWGIIISEGKYNADLHANHTYKALRVIGEDYNLRYTVWCSGENELYDLQVSTFSFPSRASWVLTYVERSPRVTQHLHSKARRARQHLRPGCTKRSLSIRCTPSRAQNVQSS